MLELASKYAAVALGAAGMGAGARAFACCVRFKLTAGAGLPCDVSTALSGDCVTLALDELPGDGEASGVGAGLWVDGGVRPAAGLGVGVEALVTGGDKEAAGVANGVKGGFRLAGMGSD